MSDFLFGYSVILSIQRLEYINVKYACFDETSRFWLAIKIAHGHTH